MNRRGRLLAAGIAVVASVLVAAAPTRPLRAGQDDVFLDGLRQRRLFELAERHCERRWNDKTLSAIQRGELAVEWIRALSDHARNSSKDERERLVERAHDIAAQFVATHPDHSMGFLVRTQESLADAMLGELLRLEAEVAADPTRQLDEARRLSRTAARALEQLDRQLTEFLPQRFRRPASTDELAAEQLASLQHQLRLQAARAQRNLALAYDDGSDDRLATLGRGVQLLEPSLRQLTPDMPLHAACCLELAAQQRLLGKPDAAREALARLDLATLDADTQLAFRAEVVRVALGQGNWNDVERLAKFDATSRGGVAAEWDFVRLEVILARWREAAARQQEMAEFQKQAVALLDEIQRDHGAYWRHRGDLLLVRLGGAAGTKNADLLARTADSLMVQGRPDEALSTYDQAAVQARESRQDATAFSLAYKAGLVQQQRQRHDDAARRLREASVAAPRQPQAPAAHLAAIWNLAQQIRAAPEASPGELGTRYVDWLDEHLSLWSDSPTTAEARLWLGAWRETRRHWAEAADAYRGVALESPQALAAWRGVVRAETRRFAPAADRSVDAVAALESAARSVWEWLDKASAPAGASADDEREVTLLKIRCLLRIPGQEDDARRALAAVHALSPTAVEELVATIRESSRTPDAKRRSSLAPVTLDLVERLNAQRDGLPPATRRTVDVAQAEALASVGKRAEAVEAFRKLATAAPQDGDLQQAYAELLESGTASRDWQAALDQWRRIAGKSPPRTSRWYRAKRGVAAMMVRLGQKSEAVKFIRFLQETPPGLAAPWKDEFESLRAQAEGLEAR